MGKALYDTFDYPKYWRGRQYEDQAERIALRRFLALISTAQKGSLVDIGGGFGRLADLYAPLFNRCLLIDPSKGLLKQAQKYLKKLSNVETRQGSVEAIPTPPDEFDVAILIRVVHHLQDPQTTFKEAYRVLKPGGFFILEFANKIHFRACLRAWKTGELNFRKNRKPANQSSPDTFEETQVFFLNHHPKVIENKLRKTGFKIIAKLSVSNFRAPILKKVFPLKLLLFLESLAQKPFTLCSFGPSIFLLCQKPES